MVITCHFLLFQLSLYIHRADFKNYLLTVNKGVEIITIHPSELYSDSKDLQWCNSNNEISYNGAIYDVLQIKNNGTSVLLYVFNDTKEFDLFSEFKKQVDELNGESGSSENNNDTSGNFYDFEFITCDHAEAYDLPSCIIDYLHKDPQLSRGFLTIFLPPPNTCN